MQYKHVHTIKLYLNKTISINRLVFILLTTSHIHVFEILSYNTRGYVSFVLFLASYEADTLFLHLVSPNMLYLS